MASHKNHNSALPQHPNVDGGRVNVGHGHTEPLPKEDDPLSDDNPRKNYATGLTPFRVRTLKLAGMVGHNGKNETHDRIDHLLIGEIDDACFSGIQRLDERKLPSSAIELVPVHVLPLLKTTRGTKLYNRTIRKWTEWPFAASYLEGPGAPEAQLAALLNRVGEGIAKDKKMAGPPLKWTAKYCNKAVPGTRCQRKPDIVLMRADDADELSDTSNGWASIFAVAELKTGTNQGRPIEQLAHSARLVFGAQPDRQFVLGFTIHQDAMTFVVFNRGGLFSSDTFDVHSEPERLINIIGGMMFADREHIGFDSTMKITQFVEAKPLDPTVEVNGHTYDICEILHVENVIRGRATVCLKVKRVVDNEVKFFVVKSGWVDERRALKEPAILEKLEGVPGIVQIVESEMLDGCTSDELEKCDGKSLGTPTTERKDGEEERIDHRRQLRVVMTPVGTPILQFKSLKELVYAFLKIVEAIEEMHKKGYLHRDVSHKNILLDESEETLSANGERGGLLIDFDYSVPDTLDRDASAVHRTGTLPFIAMEVLTNLQLPKHEYYHDLESVFYVLCYICCICDGPGKLRENFDVLKTELGAWFGNNKSTTVAIGEEKRKTVEAREDFEAKILSILDKSFDDLKPFLLSLRQLAIPPHKVLVSYVDSLPPNPDPNHKRDIWTKHMWQREPKDNFEAYKQVLREAYDALPGGDNPPQGNATTEGGTVGPAPNAIPLDPLVAAVQDREDVPLRPIDLINVPVIEQTETKVGEDTAGAETANETAAAAEGNTDPPTPTDGSNTMVGGDSPQLGKRKSASLDDYEEDDYGYPPSPSPYSRGRVRLAKLLGSTDDIRNPPSASYKNTGNPMPLVSEGQDLEAAAEIKSSQSATKKQRTS